MASTTHSHSTCTTIYICKNYLCQCPTHSLHSFIRTTLTMQQNLPTQKWEAMVFQNLEKSTADQIWPLFLDFFGLGKWFPGLATCHGMYGSNGEPGCIRYCAGFGLEKGRDTEKSENKDEGVKWSKERLVSIDKSRMTLSYEIVDSNIGFESYVSTIKIEPARGGRCAVVEWSISLEPVAGWRLEDLVGRYELGLRRMIKNMEEHISKSCSTNKHVARSEFKIFTQVS